MKSRPVLPILTSLLLSPPPSLPPIDRRRKMIFFWMAHDLVFWGGWAGHPCSYTHECLGLPLPTFFVCPVPTSLPKSSSPLPLTFRFLSCFGV